MKKGGAQGTARPTASGAVPGFDYEYEDDDEDPPSPRGSGAARDEED